MSSIHLSTFSGPAFIQRSARLVNKMNNLWLTALVLHYPNSKNSNSCAISRWHSLRHTKLLEMLFLLSWDTQGVCSGYVTRTHLFTLHWIKFKENSGFWRKRAKHCQVNSNQKLEVYYFCCFNFCFLHNFVPVLTASSSPQKRWRLLKRKHAPAQHHTRVVCYGRECLSTSRQMTKTLTFLLNSTSNLLLFCYNFHTWPSYCFLIKWLVQGRYWNHFSI